LPPSKPNSKPPARPSPTWTEIPEPTRSPWTDPLARGFPTAWPTRCPRQPNARRLGDGLGLEDYAEAGFGQVLPGFLGLLKGVGLDDRPDTLEDKEVQRVLAVLGDTAAPTRSAPSTPPIRSPATPLPGQLLYRSLHRQRHRRGVGRIPLKCKQFSASGRKFKSIHWVSRQGIPALLLSNRYRSLMPLWHKQVTLS
jgi:hypothetical protein